MSEAKPTVAPEAAKTIRPGGNIGMVGGGQLGKMFAHAATTMGYKVSVFCGSENEPAAQVASSRVTGALDDVSKIDAFANPCDVITYEFENIPAETIARCRQHAPTFPDPSVLAIAQDRELEKSTFARAGLPVTPFRSLTTGVSNTSTGVSCASTRGSNAGVQEPTQVDEITDFASQHGWPVIVKTSRSGYDGKGQQRLESPADLCTAGLDFSLRQIVEKAIPLDAEVSVVVARNASGETRCFPVFENHHRDHVLEWSRIPARVDPSLASRATEIAMAAAEVLGVVGLLCVEFFISGDQLLINEVAPRPHNSGHLTIEACHTSQFTQHVRAVCNLPLGDPSPRVGSAAMINLLGRQSPGSPDASWMDHPRLSLHWYGKHQEKPGRKIGHLTLTGQQDEDCVTRLLNCRDQYESPS